MGVSLLVEIWHRRDLLRVLQWYGESFTPLQSPFGFVSGSYFLRSSAQLPWFSDLRALYISSECRITVRFYINLSGETQSTNNPLIPTTANNRTNGSIQSTTLTEKSADTEVTLFPTSASESELQMTTKVETSSNQSNVDKPGSQEGKSNTEVLSVSLSLVLGVLAAVGVVIAVLFVRWKRWVKVEVGKIEHHSTRP